MVGQDAGEFGLVFRSEQVFQCLFGKFLKGFDVWSNYGKGTGNLEGFNEVRRFHGCHEGIENARA